MPKKPGTSAAVTIDPTATHQNPETVLLIRHLPIKSAVRLRILSMGWKAVVMALLLPSLGGGGTDVALQ